MHDSDQSMFEPAVAVSDKRRQKSVFKILYYANIVVIAGTLLIAVIDSRTEFGAGSTSVLSVLLFAAISRAIPYWTSLFVLSVWGIFLIRGYRIFFISISVILAIFVTISILILFRFATFGV